MWTGNSCNFLPASLPRAHRADGRDTGARHEQQLAARNRSTGKGAGAARERRRARLSRRCCCLPGDRGGVRRARRRSQQRPRRSAARLPDEYVAGSSPCCVLPRRRPRGRTGLVRYAEQRPPGLIYRAARPAGRDRPRAVPSSSHKPTRYTTLYGWACRAQCGPCRHCPLRPRCRRR